MRVRLTDLGRERVDAAFVALLHTEQQLLATLGDGQDAGLAAALRSLLHAAATIDQHRATS